MKITIEIIKDIYELSAKVYLDKLSKNAAIDFLEEKHGMNRGSASDYILIFKRMMDGETYKRTCNTEATNYFLTQILVNFGAEKLCDAINSVYSHIDYYEDLNPKKRLNSIRDIVSKYEKHTSFLNCFSDDKYLRSIDGMVQNIQEARREPDCNGVTLDKLDW